MWFLFWFLFQNEPLPRGHTSCAIFGESCILAPSEDPQGNPESWRSMPGSADREPSAAVSVTMELTSHDETALRFMLLSGSARAGVRPGGQPHWALGRPRRRLRMAGVEPWDHRRLQGERLDWRQRPGGRRSGPEVHPGREVPDADI